MQAVTQQQNGSKAPYFFQRVEDALGSVSARVASLTLLRFLLAVMLAAGAAETPTLLLIAACDSPTASGNGSDAHQDAGAAATNGSNPVNLTQSYLDDNDNRVSRLVSRLVSRQPTHRL